jgi:hypothetical protein
VQEAPFGYEKPSVKQRTMNLTTQVQTRRGGVVMRRLFLACCLVTLLAGCGDKAKDLYETAQLEEKQFNKPHATELYRQIVEQYPNSPYASQAKNRLAELEKR